MALESIARLTEAMRACDECRPHLPHAPRPVFAIGRRARLQIVGQAPGRVVHGTGVPWDDKSGDNLRGWLGIDRKTFYDPRVVALVPMGLCYPGTSPRGGDLPPRPECGPRWQARARAAMPGIGLTLLVGQYAQAFHLGDRARASLTETVRAFSDYLPAYLPLPHPSPRNQLWQKKNPWFAAQVLPALRQAVSVLLGDDR